MNEEINSYLNEHCRVIENIDKEKIYTISREIIHAYKDNKKVILFGNGGSAADAQHFAAEFVGRFEKERKPLPALALNCNTSSVTAIGNDYGYKHVFERQIEAFAEKGDVVISLSTSGNSENVILGIMKAHEKGCVVTGITGKDGGKMKEQVDEKYLIKINSTITSHIQEATITVLHIIAKTVENELFK
ncbi:MAG: D-sedoheptulose-7-phosphate isomerase [Thermoplasmata archaeon]